MKNLIKENTENRVNLMRLDAILEKLAPQLSTSEQEKLADVYIDLKEIADALNVTPYTIFNNADWKLLIMIMMGKVAQMKLIVNEIAEDNKEVDCWPLMKALDLVLVY
jgi:L-rhamnose mutarotase